MTKLEDLIMKEIEENLAIGAMIIVALEEAKIYTDEILRNKVRSVLSRLIDEPPEEQFRIIKRALFILKDHTPICEAIVYNLQSLSGFSHSAESEKVRGLLESFAFEEKQKDLYVCPVDPSHYRKRVSNLFEHLSCPLHDVELVPSDVSLYDDD